MKPAEILRETEAREADTMTIAEWGPVPLDVRERVVAEHGYRSRRGVEPLTAIRPASSASTPPAAPTPAVLPTPARNTASTEAGQRAIQLLTEWKTTPELRRKYPTLGDFLVARGWTSGGSPSASTAAAPRVLTEADEDARLPLLQRAEATWRANAAIRAEFRDQFDCYIAYRRAEEKGLIGTPVRGRVIRGRDVVGGAE